MTEPLRVDVPMTIVLKTLPVDAVAKSAAPRARQQIDSKPYDLHADLARISRLAKERRKEATMTKPKTSAVEKAEQAIDAEGDPVRKAELANQLSRTRLSALYEAQGTPAPVATTRAATVAKGAQPIVRERAELVRKAAEETDPTRRRELASRVDALNRQLLRRVYEGS